MRNSTKPPIPDYIARHLAGMLGRGMRGNEGGKEQHSDTTQVSERICSYHKINVLYTYLAQIRPCSSGCHLKKRTEHTTTKGLYSG